MARNLPQDFEEVYYHTKTRNYILSVALIAIACVVSFIAMISSKFSGLSMDVAFDVLMKHLNGQSYGVYYYDLIVWDYSVPRAIGGLFVGAGLAVAGCVMQSLMRNPLADPYTTGVASGASFGAALFIMMGFAVIPTTSYAFSLTTNAIIFSVIPTVAIIIISRKQSITPTTMILAGIAIMYIFRAATTLMVLASKSESVETLYRWNVGTLNNIEWDNIWIVITVTVLCSAALLYLAHDVTIMTVGDKNARSMGVRTRAVRIISLAIIALMTAAIVGYTGTIGFMGLVAPHIARMFVGSNLRYLIPASAAVGAVVLVICDLSCKMLLSELPVGVITSIIGGPLFIILILKGAKKVWY